MKTLKFDSSLVSLVLSGEKTSTWRLFDDKDLSVNDDLILLNKQIGEEFGKARIIEVREKALKGIVEADYDGHEKFESPEAMIETYKSYYGDKVTPETTVKIIKFELK